MFYSLLNNLLTRNPFEDFITIQNQVSRLFPEVSSNRQFGIFYPQMDIVDLQDEIQLIAELPGFNKEDIKITMNNSTLMVSGERKPVEYTQDAEWLRTERNFGQFNRSFRIPYPVQTERIRAEFKNGILKLVLPKREDAKPKQIEIKIGS